MATTLQFTDGIIYLVNNWCGINWWKKRPNEYAAFSQEFERALKNQHDAVTDEEWVRLEELLFRVFDWWDLLQERHDEILTGFRRSKGA